MYKHQIFWTMATVFLFAAAVMATNNHGSKNRLYATGTTTHFIDSPQMAYAIWKEKKVKGRTLILFDSYPHNMGYYSYNGEPRLLPTNLIEYSIFQNIIRMIYFVVPEVEWTEFRKQSFIRPIREATSVTKGLYLYNQSGIPMIALPPSSLPELEEAPLVYINNRVFDSTEALALLSQKKISSDIIVSYMSPAR
jgi:hypothetical protein